MKKGSGIRSPALGTPLSVPSLRTTLLLLALTLALPSCATWQELQQIGEPSPAERAEAMESMLSAAGFQMLAADSPEKRQQLESLPPMKLSYYLGKNGRIYYWMADPNFCRCLYHGNEQAYQNYQRLKLQQQFERKQQEIAEDSLAAAQMEQMEMMNPFGFAWYEPVFAY